MPRPLTSAEPRRPPTEEPPPPTQTRTTIHSIEGLRGFAAISVLLFHVLYGSGAPRLDDGVARNMMLSGYMGVDFFFVISGFLLFLPTVRSGGRFGDVRSYALRRTARILPAYYVALAVGLVMAPLLTTVDVDLPYESSRGLMSLILHLGLLQHSVGLALGFPEGFHINGGVWTLALEAMFYLLLPLVAVRYFRHPWLWLAGCFAASLLWKFAVAGSPAFGQPPFKPPTGGQLILITQFPTYLAHFAAGMTAAWLLVKLSSSPLYLRRPWAAAVFQVLGLLTVGWGMSRSGARDLAGTASPFSHWTGTTVVAGAFAVVLLSACLGPKWSQLLFSNPVSRGLGQVSYGIYLWHLPLISFAVTTLNFSPEATGGAFLRLLSFVLAGSVFLGWLSFAYIEKPFIEWARRRSRSRAPRPAGTAAVGQSV